MNTLERECECCGKGRPQWIWNLETQSAEPCPACNPSRNEDLVDAQLKRGAGTATQKGNTWLGLLVRMKRHQNHVIHARRNA